MASPHQESQNEVLHKGLILVHPTQTSKVEITESQEQGRKAGATKSMCTAGGTTVHSDWLCRQPQQISPARADFWLCWAFIVAQVAFSLVAANRATLQLPCVGFSWQWLLLLWSIGCRCMGFSSCGTWAQQLQPLGSGAQAQQLWCMDLFALQHVGSSYIRYGTRGSCIGRRILYH